MPSAIDVFREQQEAAEQLHGRLQEISALLGQVRQQVRALALSEDLRRVLRDEQDWLTRAQLAVSEVRSFREQDMLRFGPACSDDGLSPWSSRWGRRQPQARAMRGGPSRTLQNSQLFARELSSLISLSTACSR